MSTVAEPEPWFEWVCPVCPSWACGGVDEGGVAEGKRLHLRTTHDGLTFAEAIREYWQTADNETGPATRRTAGKDPSNKAEEGKQ